MKEDNSKKSKWLNIRLSDKEFDYIERQYKSTDCRKMSTWARQALLNKTIVTVTRNQSEDDMMAEVIRLRNELNAIGKNFNQAVKKLNTLTQIKEMEHWLVIFQMDKHALEKHYAEIEVQIKKMAEKWLR